MAHLTAYQESRACPTLEELAGQVCTYRSARLGDFAVMTTGREYLHGDGRLYFEVRLLPAGQLTWLPATALFLAGGGDSV